MIIDNFIKIAIFFAASAIALGAMGAHYLKEILTASQLHSFETGVRYQFFHALAMISLALNAEQFNKSIKRSLQLITLGVCFFSFSIYLLVLQETIGISLSFLAIATPLGGLILICGWLTLLISFKKKK